MSFIVFSAAENRENSADDKVRISFRSLCVVAVVAEHVGQEEPTTQQLSEVVHRDAPSTNKKKDNEKTAALIIEC